MSKELKEKVSLYLPEQKDGGEKEAFSERQFQNEDKAKIMFSLATERLLNPNTWNRFSGPGVEFHIFKDKEQITEGDYIRIKIPVPADPVENDWVRVEKIHSESNQNEDLLLVTVRPSKSPEDSSDDVKHFFDSDSSSSFVVWRKDKRLEAAVFGRNEKTNKEAEGVVESVRDAVVSTGAIMGLANIQWNTFAEEILNDEDELEPEKTNDETKSD